MSGRAGSRCRGQWRSIVLAVEERGFILAVGMAARIDSRENGGDEGELDQGASVWD